jgi:hypothetical protein
LNAFFFFGLVAQYVGSTYLYEKIEDPNAFTKLLISGALAIVLFTVYYALGYFGPRKANYIMTGIFIILLMFNFLGSAIVLWRVYFQAASTFYSSKTWLTAFSKTSI